MSSASELSFIFDTDALAQIFITGHQIILAHLKDQYGVSSYLMSEVEVELLSNRRISGLVRPRYEKALKNGWIKLLTSGDLERVSKSIGIEVTLHEIRTLASDLKLLIGNGEAHTHAAAILLGCPSVSNDQQAIRVLEANGKQMPSSVLRSFDLFGFCYHEHILSEREAEEIRTTLRGQGEWVPISMKNSTFVGGLAAMACRLSTSMAATQSSAGWSGTFYLQRRSDTP